MFEVLGFIAALIVGGALTVSSFGGVFVVYAFSGRYDVGSMALTALGTVGVIIVVLTVMHSPFTITVG